MFWDPTGFESSVAISREGVSIQCDKGVFRVVLLERIVEGEEAGEVFGVGDECCPDLYMSVLCSTQAWK